MSSDGRVRWVLALVIGIAVVIGGLLVITQLLREPEPVTLKRPAVGDVRADYLPDGTPVWVVGHEDGTVDVLSGFDPHTPSNLGKLLWWCRSAHALDNPHHGSKWDEYGTRLGGPAPSGLPGWEVRAESTRVFVGEPRAAPAADTRPVGGNQDEREWCMAPAPHEVIVHTFDGWRVWDSPIAAVEAAPRGWILLEGELTADRQAGTVRLCAMRGCDDSVVATNVILPPVDAEFGPLIGGRFIARVHDGALWGVTHTIWLDDPNP